jgi:hypothetical protein
VHHQQQQTQQVQNSSSVTPGATTNMNVSVIAHAPSQQQQQTNSNVGNGSVTPNSINGSSSGEHRSTAGYSINGILGIQHATDPNGNSIKRERHNGHGE